jgi:acyl carrier protein
MEKEQILSEVQEIFRNILDQENLVLSAQTTAADVEDWDSLSHIQLVVAIEKHFKIRFTSKEIQSWKNVDEMISSIQSK